MPSERAKQTRRRIPPTPAPETVVPLPADFDPSACDGYAVGWSTVFDAPVRVKLLPDGSKVEGVDWRYWERVQMREDVGGARNSNA